MLIGEHGPTHSMIVYLMLIAAISAVQLALWAYAALVADLADSSLDRQARLRRTVKMAVPALAFTILAGAGLAGVDVTNPLPLIAVLLVVAATRRWLGRSPAGIA